MMIFIAYLVALFSITMHIFEKFGDAEASYFLLLALWIYVTNKK